METYDKNVTKYKNTNQKKSQVPIIQFFVGGGSAVSGILHVNPVILFLIP
jgi:hypothetical protein